jgi:histone H3/H4
LCVCEGVLVLYNDLCSQEKLTDHNFRSFIVLTKKLLFQFYTNMGLQPKKKVSRTHKLDAKYPGNQAMRRCIKRAGISRISKNASEYTKCVLEKVTARVLHNALEETVYNRKNTVSDEAIMRSLERLGESLHM